MTTGNDVIAEAVNLAGLLAHIWPLSQNDRYTCCCSLRDLLDRWHREGLVGPVGPQLDCDAPLYCGPGYFKALAYNLALDLARFYAAKPRPVVVLIAESLKRDLIQRMTPPIQPMSYQPMSFQFRPVCSDLDMQSIVSSINSMQGEVAERLKKGLGFWKVAPGLERIITPKEKEVVALLLEAKAEYQAQLKELRSRAA